MPLTREQFTRGLHEECLEEASFFYQQRKTLRERGELTRPALQRLERRLESYLDALSAGGEAAVGLCLDRLPEGDDGEAYAAVRLLSRLGKAEALARVLEQVPALSAEHLAGVREGLCQEMPRGTRSGLLRPLLAEEPVIRYGMELYLEPDALLTAQQQALAQGRAWLQAHPGRLVAGRWD